METVVALKHILLNDQCLCQHEIIEDDSRPGEAFMLLYINQRSKLESTQRLRHTIDDFIVIYILECINIVLIV